ncbi:MAG: 16S rRNA (guanine(527)-N(7))-methyltransferase RsmG [Planctomycetes bacterium]|nr:16S rRNA (guanine(527)-N(7))-methyltransferase RsmG [Planctomycetota bacterium]
MPTLAAEVRSLLVPQLDGVLAGHAPGLDRDALADALAAYSELLVEWNGRLNLTRIVDPEGIVFRHLLDALLALPLLDGTGDVLDLGSGGGVPGIPLALACPDRRFVLSESRGKKARALDAMVAALDLGTRVEVTSERAEERLRVRPADVVVVRAVGSVESLLRLLAPRRAGFRRLLLYKGPGVDDELAQIRPQLGGLGFAAPERVERSLPGDHGRRVLLAFAGRRR